MPCKPFATWTGALALVLLASGEAAAERQRLDLAGGFVPDPQRAEVSVLGTRAADELVRGCAGRIAADESLVVQLRGAYAPLHIYAHGEALTGLLVRGPDGVHRCALLDADGIARVRFERPLEGAYAVWPSAAADAATARVLVSERDLGVHEVTAPPPPSAEDLEPARQGVAVLDPAATRQRVGGGPLVPATVSASGLQPGCVGHVAEGAADLVVEVPEDLPVLSLYVESEVDTVLAVRDPGGGWHCDDDTFGPNPAVTLFPAPAGRYHMLVGTYAPGVSGDADLWAAVGEPVWSGNELHASAPPAAGHVQLPADGVHEVTVALAGNVAASRLAPHCAGSIEPDRPDVVVRLDEPLPVLRLRATSTLDTTLIVVAPDGGVHCDDDTYGLDPALELYGAEAGDYAVWVGRWGEEGDAVLIVGDVDAELGGLHAPHDNPFIGRELRSAGDVLDILRDEGGIDEFVTFERIEEEETGFVLHGVRIHDPWDDDPPLHIARLAVADLDLEGLSELGEPRWFSILAEGMEYDAVAETLSNELFLPLPAIEGSPRVTFGISVLPARPDRSQVDLLLRLDGQLGLRITGLVEETGGFTGDFPFERSVIEQLVVELQDYGYLGAFLREQAMAEGKTMEAFIAEGVEAIQETFAPIEPGSLHDQLVAAMTAMLHGLDRPGALRIALNAGSPQGLDDLMLALFTGMTGTLGVEIDYAPIEDGAE